MTHTQSTRVACLDMEGTLIPELWPHIAQKTGIQAFCTTTRDIPDYQLLVNQRMALLQSHKITMQHLQELTKDVDFLPGAQEFVKELRRTMKIVIVSDAFAPLILPWTESLGATEVLCNQWAIDEKGYATQAHYLRAHGKHEVVESLHSKGHWVLAVGDAFNDLSMLRCADLGFLFSPSNIVADQARDIYQTTRHSDIVHACRKMGFLHH